jgi:uncharacterized protein YqjF (DUF2071 family)
VSTLGKWPVGRQHWRDLLFLHWPVPPEVVRPLVPRPLEIDTLEGQAYVSLIPFAITGSRPRPLPRALSMSFLETNLRTYVRVAGGRPGIFFFSLEASSLAAVLGARAFYGLPYFPAIMARKKEGDRIVYTSRRKAGGGAGGAALDVAWRVGPLIGTAAPGTREHFLVERYLLYVERRRRIYSARVRHQPYPLYRASVERMAESLLTACGLPAPTTLPLVQHSSGVDVDIFWLQQVGLPPT